MQKTSLQNKQFRWQHKTRFREAKSIALVALFDAQGWA
jgi:hypothetical protein